MLKLKKLITGNGFTYENPTILYDQNEIFAKYRRYIAKGSFLQQIILKTEDETKVMTNKLVCYVQLRFIKPPAFAEKVKRLVISGEVSFSPAWLIKPEDISKIKDVPKLFNDQIVFIADNHLCICQEWSLIEIVL